MDHTIVLKLLLYNADKFEEVLKDLRELEAACYLVADSEPENIKHYTQMMINALIKYKTSKFELLEESVCKGQLVISPELSSLVKENSQILTGKLVEDNS